MRNRMLSKLVPAMLAASGFHILDAQASLTLWDLRRDDYVRITATQPRVAGAVSVLLDIRNDTLILRGQERNETLDGPVALNAITSLEIGRRKVSVDKATWGPILTMLAGAGLAGGATYAVTCGREGCRGDGPQGLPAFAMGILGACIGAGAGQEYFSRGDIRWKPVVLIR